MVFGMSLGAGVLPLIRLHGRVNAAVYTKLLMEHVILPPRVSQVAEPIFMQDNTPCDAVKMAKKVFGGGRRDGLAG